MILPDKAFGTHTFLFTDLEGSTRLWERFPQAMKRALERHDSILLTAVTAAGGQVVKTTGDGLMAVFGSAADAVRACLAAQRGLVEESWRETGALRVRMGLHSGEAQLRGDDYFGPAVIRSARIMAVGHGGQVLLSAASAALVADQLPDGAALLELGAHRLKDLGRPEQLFQLVHPAIPHDFPPLATPDRRPNNLPTQASTFIGRDTELREIRARIERESVRLLTLTGPGGTGKTRLALRVAADEIDRFDHGVFFIDLSPMRDTQAVLASMARTIGLTETGDQSLQAELERQLHHQRVLLILDNFEQVMAAAPTAAELLSGCPRLKLLVTSREALHVRGEHLYAVPPLSLPVAGRERFAAADLAGYEAVQLFVERAQAVRPDFRLTNENAAAIADICQRLDGLPLAIELATSRINLFSPKELLERLGSRLAMLRGGPRDLPSRQRTLRATIEWSYQLLGPGERRLFELLAVFSGVELEAVEAVAEELDWLTETGGTLDGLASLLGKSLVRKADSGEAAPRLLMLETIREYAAERLEDLPEFAAAARRTHAAYFADFAKRQWQHLTGQRREAALAAMTADIDNLRLAWRHWVGERDLVQLNKLVDSLWLLYDARGWYQDTIGLTNDLLDVLSSAPSTPERATQEITLRMSLARALMATKGYSREVEEAYATALQPFQGRELPQLFPVLRSLASYYIAQSQFDKGARIGREILQLAERQNDDGMLIEGHLVLGVSTITLEGIEVGLEHLDEAIARLRAGQSRSRPFRLGNDSGITCFTTSAFYLWMLGYPDRAVARADEAMALATQLQHPYSLAYTLFHCGYLQLWLHEPELVRNYALQLLQVVEQYDFPIWRALGTCLLGMADAELGRAEEGLAQFDEGIALYQELKTPPVFWPGLLAIKAGVNALAGRVAEGLVVVDEALQLAASGDTSSIPELSLLKGDLLTATGAADADAAPWFQRAFDGAGELGVRMTQLRAALRLCRLQRSQGTDDADRLLRSVYDTFTEGFATADLVEAGTLLERLPPPSAK
ncbi:MAG TPA: adenylate/guanylate cyclase domain-containing protein [Actinomycetes bacterium]|nr:adenylate/guanylate cyclase domain-containing protein [Actinomycetes bacterium]